ncbi:unnamed protein product [Staurois parvus]|uniref:Uncharacterized protein n=1 Tax=Staurois parvus TaxID=386267 RepID=A0ABN9GDK7_9NEOB|nr:unnamed protein product [Staurois parvus]
MITEVTWHKAMHNSLVPCDTSCDQSHSHSISQWLQKLDLCCEVPDSCDH